MARRLLRRAGPHPRAAAPGHDRDLSADDRPRHRGRDDLSRAPDVRPGRLGRAHRRVGALARGHRVPPGAAADRDGGDRARGVLERGHDGAHVVRRPESRAARQRSDLSPLRALLPAAVALASPTDRLRRGAPRDRRDHAGGTRSRAARLRGHRHRHRRGDLGRRGGLPGSLPLRRIRPHRAAHPRVAREGGRGRDRGRAAACVRDPEPAREHARPPRPPDPHRRRDARMRLGNHLRPRRARRRLSSLRALRRAPRRP